MTENNNKYDLQDRLINLSYEVIKATKQLPRNTEIEVMTKQLIRSITSVGANYSESQSGISNNDFHYRIIIALRELNESIYWIRLITKLHPDTEIKHTLEEAKEIGKILGKINSKTIKTSNNL